MCRNAHEISHDRIMSRDTGFRLLPLAFGSKPKTVLALDGVCPILPPNVPRMKPKFFPPYKDEGEVAAAWGQAQLVKYLDRKVELRGGSRQDRVAARKWMSIFWHEAVVGDGTGRRI